MHAGFNMLEAGAVRFKIHQNILAKNIVVLTIGFLCWYVFDWAGDTFEASGSDVVVNKANFRNWFFQGAFCATAGTTVSGAMASPFSRP